MEECFFIHGLRRSGEITMTIFERLSGLASGSEELLERRRKQFAEFWRSVHPLIGYVLALVPEKRQVQRETPIGKQMDDVAHLLEKYWLTIGGESHHLVFITVMRKAEVLCKCLIENTE